MLSSTDIEATGYIEFQELRIIDRPCIRVHHNIYLADLENNKANTEVVKR